MADSGHERYLLYMMDMAWDKAHNNRDPVHIHRNNPDYNYYLGIYEKHAPKFPDLSLPKPIIPDFDRGFTPKPINLKVRSEEIEPKNYFKIPSAPISTGRIIGLKNDDDDDVPLYIRMARMKL
jgi:hypothetical protein